MELPNINFENKDIHIYYKGVDISSCVNSINIDEFALFNLMERIAAYKLCGYKV